MANRRLISVVFWLSVGAAGCAARSTRQAQDECKRTAANAASGGSK